MSPSGGWTFKIKPRQMPVDRHRRLARGVGAARVIVVQGRWLGDFNILELLGVFRVGRPFSMGRLVVVHEEERLVLGTLLKELGREVGDEVGRVAVQGLARAAFDEIRVHVLALSGQDAPIVKARGIAGQMPLTDDAGVVAGGLQVFRQRRLAAVKAVEYGHAILVAVLASEYRRATRRAN